MGDLTALPTVFAAGTTVQYKKLYPDYPADGGWTAKLILNGGDPATPVKKSFDATVDTDGKTFIFTLPASGTPSTAELTTGRYVFVEQVTKAADTPDTVKIACSGRIDVSPDIGAAAPGALISQLEKDLIVVRAAKNKQLTKDMQSYQIQGRAVVRLDFAQLVKEENRILREIAAEKRKGQFAIPIRGNFVGPQ